VALVAGTGAGIPAGAQTPAAAPAAKSAAAAALVRGFASIDSGNGEWMIQLCAPDSRVKPGAPVSLRDATPAGALLEAVSEIRRLMARDAQPRVYVELRGTVAKDRVVATRLLRALGYVTDCSAGALRLPADTWLAAAGNEPSWRLQITPRGGEFEVLGGRRVSFAAAPFAPRAGSVPSPVELRAGDGRTAVRVQWTEELCADGMSESGYGARVRVRIDQQEFRGCATRF
jgi:uncharacterized membrane protein